jgi:hypothetical protein
VTDGGLIDKTKEQISNSTKQGKVRQRQREMRSPFSGANMCASLIGAVRGALEYIGIRLPRRGPIHLADSQQRISLLQGSNPRHIVQANAAHRPCSYTG